MLLVMKTTFNKMEMTCGFMLAFLLDSLLDYGECVELLSPMEAICVVQIGP